MPFYVSVYDQKGAILSELPNSLRYRDFISYSVFSDIAKLLNEDLAAHFLGLKETAFTEGIELSGELLSDWCRTLRVAEGAILNSRRTAVDRGQVIENLRETIDLFSFVEKMGGRLELG